MSSLVTDAGVLGARSITRSARNPASILGAVFFPLLFFLLFNLIMRRIMGGRGFDYAQLLPSAIVVQAMMFTAMSSAYFVAEDRLVGVSARLRSMPIHRAAPAFGRAIADSTRAFVSLTVVVLVGVAFGMRFDAGLVWIPVYVGVALLFAIAASMVFGLLGYVASTPDAAVSMASIPYLPLLMLSTAFVPVDDFPDWLEPFVEAQPVTVTIDALRALAGDGDIGSTVFQSVAWSAALFVVFAFLTVRAVRRSS